MSEIEIYRALGAVVAKRRKSLGLTQAHIAARIGLTRASLANIETGRQKVLLHQVYLLAGALGLDSIQTLAPDMVTPGSQAPRQPIDNGKVTDVQRGQVEHAIHQALTRGRLLGQRSS